MLKYKFKDKTIRISDDAAYRLDIDYPKEVSIEAEDFSGEGKALAFKKTIWMKFILFFLVGEDQVLYMIMTDLNGMVLD